MSAAPATSPNLIGAERVVDGVGELVRRNPADTSEIISVFPLADEDGIRAAIGAARDAQPAWGALGAPTRGELLQRAATLMAERAEPLAGLITSEEGKALRDSHAEVTRAIATLRFYGSCGRLATGQTLPSERPGTRIFTERFPRGVVALITPWNFPLAIPCQKLAPALVCGNAIVLKPSSTTPLVALQLCEILLEAGVPQGVVNLVTADGDLAGGVIARDPGIAAISFTGSEAVGMRLQDTAGRLPRPLQLELGGKNACIVLADADVERAVEVLVIGAFGLTGQSCTATGLILVADPLHDEIVERLAAAAAGMSVGDGHAPDTQVGPAASETELSGTLSAIDRAQNEGAQLVTGGERLTGNGGAQGWFSRPAVLAGVQPGTTVAREEIFGPVAVVARVADLDEAIDVANASPFGLSAAVCTRSLAAAEAFVQRIDVGIVKVNEPTSGLELHVPFGGAKRSSNGSVRELGVASLDFFSREKSVYLRAGTA